MNQAENFEIEDLDAENANAELLAIWENESLPSVVRELAGRKALELKLAMTPEQAANDPMWDESEKTA